VNERKRASESCGNHGNECESFGKHVDSGNEFKCGKEMVMRWGQTNGGLE
jgi:hypothetical protein